MNDYKPIVNVPLDILIDVCGNGKRSKEDIKEIFRKLNDENIHEIFRYRKFNEGFADYITFYSNGEYAIGQAKPCYEEFLKKICEILNIPKRSRYVDDDKLTNELKERIQVLRTLGDETHLQDEFIKIYRDLQNGRTYIRDLKNAYKNQPKDDLYRKKEEVFYKSALSLNFDRLIPKQVELYTRFVERRKDYKKQIESKNYNEFVKENFDINKLALFLAYHYLEFTKKTNNPETLRFLSRIIDKYTNSKGSKDIVITLQNGYMIDYDTIIYKDHELKAKIKHLTEAEVEWELIPPGGRDKPIASEGSTRIKMSGPEVEELRRRGRERTNFYEGTNYILKAAGTVKFHGYLAYFYPNGEVILDRKYEDRYPSTAMGNAIYHFKARYFQMISGMHKCELKKIPMVGHMNHTDTWREKVQTIIDTKGEEEDIKQAQEIIESIKKRSK